MEGILTSREQVQITETDEAGLVLRIFLPDGELLYLCSTISNEVRQLAHKGSNYLHAM